MTIVKWSRREKKETFGNEINFPERKQRRWAALSRVAIEWLINGTPLGTKKKTNIQQRELPPSKKTPAQCGMKYVTMSFIVVLGTLAKRFTTLIPRIAQTFHLQCIHKNNDQWMILEVDCSDENWIIATILCMWKNLRNLWEMKIYHNPVSDNLLTHGKVIKRLLWYKIL